MEEKKEGRSLAIWLDAETYERLEQMSGNLKITRSKLASNLIKTGLDDLKVCDALGVIAAVQALEKAKEAISGVLGDIKAFA